MPKSKTTPNRDIDEMIAHRKLKEKYLPDRYPKKDDEVEATMVKEGEPPELQQSFAANWSSAIKEMNADVARKIKASKVIQQD